MCRRIVGRQNGGDILHQPIQLPTSMIERDNRKSTKRIAPKVISVTKSQSGAGRGWRGQRGTKEEDPTHDLWDVIFLGIITFQTKNSTDWMNCDMSKIGARKREVLLPVIDETVRSCDGGVVCLARRLDERDG